MKKYSVIATIACLLLSACARGAIPPTIASGRSITTEHGTERFAAAAEGARQYCGTMDLSVKHLGTDTPGRSISRFECVPRP